MLVFYDIEVFKHDSLVVFKDINNQEIAHFWNPFHSDDIYNVIAGNVLIGYNNHHYDDLILAAMIYESRQAVIKGINDTIIKGGNVISSETRVKDIPELYNSLDCFQQIDVSMPSLKRIEGNMGRSILESATPFNIDRPLTEEEKETVLNYCRYDVENTIEIYKLRTKSYFEARTELLNMIPEKERKKMVRNNTTSLSGFILLGRNKLNTNNHIVPTIEGVPEEVVQMWRNAEGLSNLSELETKKYVHHEYGTEFTFGFGGLHGINDDGQKRFSKLKLLDVASMYPSIIIYLQALGEEGTRKYKELRDERVSIKHTDPVRAGALKLILNSVYGNLKNQYSVLFNPIMAVSVCVYGQRALYDLCGRLYRAGYKIVNVNTDGVGFVDNMHIDEHNTEPLYRSIWKQWEIDWHMQLELDEFDTWIQKDVNNYIAKQGDHIKVKGGDVNKYHSDKFFANNNARIIQIALVEKVINGTSPTKTIQNHLDQPEVFQYILSAGRTFKGVEDDNGVQQQNVNRIFAVRSTAPGQIKLYKITQDGRRINFPDMPDRYKLWNDEVSKYTAFRDEVDINHYIKIVNKNLERWK